MRANMEWFQRNRRLIFFFAHGAVALVSLGMAGYGMASREYAKVGPALLSMDGHHIESAVRSIQGLGFGSGKDYVLTFEKGYPGEVIFSAEVLNDFGASGRGVTLDLGRRIRKGDFVIVDSYAGLPPHRPAGVHISRVANGVPEVVLEIDQGRRRFRELVARAGTIGNRYVYASVALVPSALLLHLVAVLLTRARTKGASRG